MNSSPTFRDYIEENKRHVLKYLEGKGFISTQTIAFNYGGEKYIYQVRKALKELEAAGKVECEIRGMNSKYWKLSVEH